MNNNFKKNIVLFVLLCFSTCKEKPKTVENTQKNDILVSFPSFNADSAYNQIAKQVAFGPRVPSTKAHIKCGDFLIEQLKKYGCKLTVQTFDISTFDNKRHTCRNIMGSINPDAQKRILLASHWDSRPFADQESDKKTQKTPIDGANDGASGVGILLEMARTIQLATNKPNVGIDFLLFDIEDYGQPDFSELPEKQNTWCLGSQYWASNKGNYKAEYGVLLDMVGGKNAKFHQEGTSMYYASGIVQKVWSIASNAGFGSVFIQSQVDQITDDHLYVNGIAKIPMVDIIEYDNSDGIFFSNTWHTKADNLENIDKTTLKAVGQTLLQLVYLE
ncbi:MAG: M28 family peptidase [Bacteroidetes bacterium]|nr:MAG: M28 family peptidase [Bacteroidota bacterium]